MKEVRTVRRKEGKESDFFIEVNNLQEQGYDVESIHLSTASTLLAILTKRLENV